MRRPLLFAALIALTASAAAAAVDSGWSQVAFERDGDCTLSVTGNGRFFRIEAGGLAPGASGRFLLANGTMKPLDWRVRADGAGAFARYYLPFRWHHDGGTVSVRLVGGGCSLGTAFDWRRAGVTVR